MATSPMMRAAQPSQQGGIAQQMRATPAPKPMQPAAQPSTMVPAQKTSAPAPAPGQMPPMFDMQYRGSPPAMSPDMMRQREENKGQTLGQIDQKRMQQGMLGSMPAAGAVGGVPGALSPEQMQAQQQANDLARARMMSAPAPAIAPAAPAPQTLGQIDQARAQQGMVGSMPPAGLAQMQEQMQRDKALAQQANLQETQKGMPAMQPPPYMPSPGIGPMNPQPITGPRDMPGAGQFANPGQMTPPQALMGSPQAPSGAARRPTAADALRLQKAGDIVGAQRVLKEAVGKTGNLTAADALRYLRQTGDKAGADMILQAAVGRQPTAQASTTSPRAPMNTPMTLGQMDAARLQQGLTGSMPR